MTTQMTTHPGMVRPKRRFLITEVYGSAAVGEYLGATGRDALAAYAMGEGFSDPRLYIGTEEDFYYVTKEGLDAMVFTNTELVATPL